MLFSQNILTALRGLMANKLRSALTILGIVIGVAAVVALMAIGNGATSSITNRITSNGSNLLNIQAGRSQRPAAGEQRAPTYLTYSDYLALSKTLTDIAGIAPAYQSSYTVTQGTQSSRISVTGVTEDYLKVHTYEIEVGRGINANDRAKQNPVAVIGATTATDLFPSGSPVGQKIKVNGVSFTVVGTLKSKGSSGFTNEDDVVFVPLETGYSQLFKTVKKLSTQLQSQPVPPKPWILFRRRLPLFCATSIISNLPPLTTSASRTRLHCSPP
jgi:putative ABC transport system permease protein